MVYGNNTLIPNGRKIPQKLKQIFLQNFKHDRK